MDKAFDGDQMNLTLLTDNWLSEHASRHAPHNWVFSTDAPHQLSGNLELQAPIIANLANWLHADYLPN